jgi:hypothetical protein
MALAVASAAVAYLVTKQTVLALAPWAVAALGSFGSLSVFSTVEAKRRASQAYSRDPSVGLVYAVAAVLAVAAVVATAVQVGFWAARL